MTAIVSLEGTDGIVLASDSRETTLDGFYNDNSEQKLQKISENIGLLTSGDATLPITLIETLKRNIEDNPQLKDNITATADQFRQILLNFYTAWFGNINPKPDLLFILSGYNVSPAGKEIKIFNLWSGMNFVPQPQINGYATGGQYLTPRAIISRLYSKDKNVENLTKLAVYAITETARTNIWVGGLVRVMQIKEDGIKILNNTEVESIVKRNNKKGKKNEDSFYNDR